MMIRDPHSGTDTIPIAYEVDDRVAPDMYAKVDGAREGRLRNDYRGPADIVLLDRGADVRYRFFPSKSAHIKTEANQTNFAEPLLHPMWKRLAQAIQQ
jgi:hypothetical protein